MMTTGRSDLFLICRVRDQVVRSSKYGYLHIYLVSYPQLPTAKYPYVGTDISADLKLLHVKHEHFQ